MNVAENTLMLDRGERASQRNPFFNSYHQVNMVMSKIKWFIDKDSMILGDKNPGYGINSNNALFESLKFFSEPDFRKFQNIATRNPVSVLKMYSDQVGKRILNADDAARQINSKMDAGMIQSLLYELVSNGFVNYDAEKNLLELKDKVSKTSSEIEISGSLNQNKSKDEALLALTTLGFPKTSAEKALEKAIKQQGISTDSVEMLIKQALKNF